ncbi:MAG: ABC transporter substrate-binding protein [Deltaproteobacteria bacterium]|nr:ABC transporter substrate-binding protein [Deltaproteobacteria bacterium]
MRLSAVGLIIPLALSLLVAPRSSDAQAPARVPRIGFLALHPAPSPRSQAFEQGLQELGYVEGQTIALEYRWAAGRADRLPALAAELVRLEVDVIVAVGDAVIRATMNATRTIPIVMAIAGDPVGSGFVASLARPGGNVTGLSFLAPELSVKRLELLKEVVPGLSRVAVLRNPANPASALALREMEAAARALGVQLQPLEVRAPDEFENAFSAIARGHAGALLALPDGLFFTHRARLTGLALKRRLPAMGESREYTEAGGLLAYGPSPLHFFRRAATYVDKILKGAKPADLPVERPTRFELVINLKTARALGLTIPRHLLIWADKVIQ